MKFGKIMNFKMVTTNPRGAASYVRDNFNGKNVEQEIVARICACAPGCGCERVLAGGVVYEFIKPTPAMPELQAYLNAHGPYTYSTCIHVEDVGEAVQTLVDNGCKVIKHLAGADGLPWNMFYAGSGDPVEYALVDATAQCGLIFEIMQANEQWPSLIGRPLFEDVGVFMHCEVVVPDGRAAAKFMRDVWGGENVEQNISERICNLEDSEDCGCEHILSNGIVFQMIQPTVHLTGWGAHLDFHGPSVRCMCHHVQDVGVMYEKLIGSGSVAIPSEHGVALQVDKWPYIYAGEGSDYECAWIDSRAQCAMNFEFLRRCYQWPCHTGYFYW